MPTFETFLKAINFITHPKFLKSDTFYTKSRFQIAMHFIVPNIFNGSENPLEIFAKKNIP